MNLKCVRVLLVFLVLMSGSSFALDKWGIPPQHYLIEYRYYVDNEQVGAKTYHCNGSVTQWGIKTAQVHEYFVSVYK